MTIIGGYLGAGKTTLLNHLLTHADGHRFAVLVNDFGEVDIDGALIRHADDAIVTLTNGCVCCSLADGLVIALDQVRARLDGIDHVLVEASGVADPAGIIPYGVAAGFDVRRPIVVVDATQVRRRAADRYTGDTVLTQLGGAGTCVVNKVDLVGSGELEALRRWLTEVAPDVPIVEAVRSVVDPSIVVDGVSPGAPRSRTYDDPDLGRADDVHDVHDGGGPHQAWTIETDDPLDRETVLVTLDALPTEVVRVKGFVYLDDDPQHRYVVQRAGGRTDLERADAWGGRSPATTMVVIAVGDGVDPIALRSALSGRARRTPTGR
jgi:G3E family GTPase